MASRYYHGGREGGRIHYVRGSPTGAQRLRRQLRVGYATESEDGRMSETPAGSDGPPRLSAGLGALWMVLRDVKRGLSGHFGAFFRVAGKRGA